MSAMPTAGSLKSGAIVPTGTRVVATDVSVLLFVSKGVYRVQRRRPRGRIDPEEETYGHGNTNRQKNGIAGDQGWQKSVIAERDLGDYERQQAAQAYANHCSDHADYDGL